MKYIRTKDGIKKVFRKLKDGFYLVKVSKYKYYHYYPDCEVADTIEELCDYIFFRCLDLGGEELIIKKLPLDYSLEKLYKDMEIGLVKDVKLAILTDKGLIYVAKVNNKGELDLL